MRSGPSKGHFWAVVVVWLINQEPAKGKTENLELRKSGEEACGLTSEGRYKVCGSRSHFNVYQTVLTAEEAPNSQLDSMIHPVEMSHPLISEHAQWASGPSSHRGKDGSHAWPNRIGSPH